MWLASLKAASFRCFETISLDPHPGLNLIFGPNAAGKTSLLEAIYLLGRGRSFRTSLNRALIHDGSPEFRVSGRIEDGKRGRTISIDGRVGQTIAYIDNDLVERRSVLADCFPVEVARPNIHDLVAGGPGQRRRFLDRGMFHVEHSFLDHWRRYIRAVRQRNAALRQEAADVVVRGWDQELIKATEAITEKRRSYVEVIEVEVSPLAAALGLESLTLDYRPGWSGESFAAALVGGLKQDRRYRSTQIGPHRAELAVTVGVGSTRDRLSRGQEKLVGAALLLAQSAMISRLTGQPCVFLVDDPAADLDRESLSRLMHVIESQAIQVFITSLDRTAIPISVPSAMFHVKQGAVALVV